MENLSVFSEYFFYRLLINTAFMVVLIQFIYFPTYHKRDSFFTFFLLNFIVFLLSFMLEKAKAFNSIGSAFGLLAAFSLLRFRTETITIKDMTYLFIIMAVGLINSIMKGTYLEIGGINLMIAAGVYIIDGNHLIKNQKTKMIDYNVMENIKPDQQERLIQDLHEKTGLDIRKTSIEEIDLIKNKVVIKIYYY